LCRSEALFYALEATQVLLGHLAHSVFLTALDFALHKPVFLLGAPNVLLQALCGVWSSHWLVPTVFWEMLWE